MRLVLFSVRNVRGRKKEEEEKKNGMYREQSEGEGERCVNWAVIHQHRPFKVKFPYNAHKTEPSKKTRWQAKTRPRFL